MPTDTCIFLFIWITSIVCYVSLLVGDMWRWMQGALKTHNFSFKPHMLCDEMSGIEVSLS